MIFGLARMNDLEEAKRKVTRKAKSKADRKTKGKPKGKPKGGPEGRRKGKPTRKPTRKPKGGSLQEGNWASVSVAKCGMGVFVTAVVDM